MKRFKNILFIADRGDGLNEALDRAVQLSRSNEARLTVMDVVPDAGVADYIARAYDVDFNATLREQRLKDLETLTQTHSDAGSPIYTAVSSGTLFIEVVRAVQRNGHDLVIKMAQHDSGLRSALFGSTDMHLLRKCPCPVWIDRLGSAKPYRRILAAVDPFDDEFGDLPKFILELATSLAHQEQAELDILHAWELPGESMLANGRGRIPKAELDQLLEQTRKHHRHALNNLLSHYGLNTHSDNVHLRKGRAAETISDFARGRNVDLIVMGTLGRVGVAGLLIGNTAEDVLRDTTTAVLAVKPRAFVSPVR